MDGFVEFEGFWGEVVELLALAALPEDHAVFARGHHPCVFSIYAVTHNYIGLKPEPNQHPTEQMTMVINISSFVTQSGRVSLVDRAHVQIVSLELDQRAKP